MDLLLRLLLLVTLIGYVAAEQNLGEENLLDHPSEEKSRFKKFLNLFGIGTTKQFQPNEYHVPEFNPYRYPCAVSTSTTTPAPVVLSPLLCPFPPMVPTNLKPPHEGGEFLHPPLPHPAGFDQLPPPPGSLPHAGGNDFPGPHPSIPGLYPQPYLPSGQQPPILIPIQAGQYPSFPFPGPNFPNQPPPIQHFPNPVQPGKVPTLPEPFHPSVDQHVQNPEKPVMVDPLNPENPEKVNPVITNPFDPIKVNPTISDPTKPIFVDPVDIKPSQPLLVDPATIQPGQPLVINPLNPHPSVTVNSLPPPPSFNDPKAFSKYPAVSSFGPANVLINPGFPELPPSTVRPMVKPELPGKPLLSAGSFVRPSNVLINPGLPLDPPATNLPNLPYPHLINPGHQPRPFYPSNSGMGNIHLIPMLPIQVSPNKPPFGANPFSPILYPPVNGGNITLPMPPNFLNTSLPPPPPLNDTPPRINESVVPLPIDNNVIPSSVQPTQTGHYFPLNPSLVVPEHPRPPCGTPFLKPYVPPGFHLSSVNQFIGVSPVQNTRFNFPCPTLDLLQTLDFNIMRSLILSSGLLPLFDHTRNYTLFLPSDAAFRRLPRWFRDSLEVDKKLKKALLLNHLVKEDLPLSILENEELILSARPGGNRLRINIYQSDNTYRAITVDGAEVERGDILTSSGRVHIVNKVLMPNLPRNAAQFLSEKLEFESFWNLVKQADLIQNFQDARPFTLFIPVNDAVLKLNDSTFLSDREKLRNFVNYHMVNGTYYSNGLINNEFLLTNYEKEIKMQVTTDTYAKSLSGINGRVRVLKSDITLTNGVAHVIDQCISEETPFYVYPQSDEFKNEFGVLRRNFRVVGEEKNIENAF